MIKVGSRVLAKVGPLVHRESGSASQSNSKRARKVRTDYHGTVVSSEPDSLWLIHWDECDKTSLHKSSQLKFIANPPLNELNPTLLQMWQENSRIKIGNHQSMLDYTAKLIRNSENVPDTRQKEQQTNPNSHPPSDLLIPNVPNNASVIDTNKRTDQEPPDNVTTQPDTEPIPDVAETVEGNNDNIFVSHTEESSNSNPDFHIKHNQTGLDDLNLQIELMTEQATNQHILRKAAYHCEKPLLQRVGVECRQEALIILWVH